MSKRSWETFTTGTPIGGAVILELVEDGRLQTEVTYAVRWSCCGREAHQTHSQLAKRHRTERELCRSCAGRERIAVRMQSRGKPSTREVPAIGYTPEYVFEIPLPGISGIWAHFGELGPRHRRRGADFKSGRGA